jgi:hypothetical protein
VRRGSDGERGAEQAMPGPLFNISAYIGALIAARAGGACVAPTMSGEGVEGRGGGRVCSTAKA